MAKTLYSFQEEGWRIESDQTSVVTVHPEVRISVKRRHNQEFDATYEVTMYINVQNGNKTIGIAENEYESMDALMDDLGIDDVDEVWEILE